MDQKAMFLSANTDSTVCHHHPGRFWTLIMIMRCGQEVSRIWYRMSISTYPGQRFGISINPIRSQQIVVPTVHSQKGSCWLGTSRVLSSWGLRLLACCTACIYPEMLTTPSSKIGQKKRGDCIWSTAPSTWMQFLRIEKWTWYWSKTEALKKCSNERMPNFFTSQPDKFQVWSLVIEGSLVTSDTTKICCAF